MLVCFGQSSVSHVIYLKGTLKLSEIADRSQNSSYVEGEGKPHDWVVLTSSTVWQCAAVVPKPGKRDSQAHISFSPLSLTSWEMDEDFP